MRISYDQTHAYEITGSGWWRCSECGNTTLDPRPKFIHVGDMVWGDDCFNFDWKVDNYQMTQAALEDWGGYGPIDTTARTTIAWQMGSEED